MSRLNKEFKNGVKQEFAEVDYIGSKILVRIIIVVVICTVLGAIGGVVYKKWRVEKDREIFKQSITYTETAASFLADRYKEYNEADNEQDKNAIEQYVIMRYPNLDEDEIDNEALRMFYHNCLR